MNKKLSRAVQAALLTLLLAPASACDSKRSGGEPKREREANGPNIVLILADDLGFECIGANGGESYETPNLDRLAATGARFTHCYATPTCTPTRVQLMTGRYTFRNYTRFGALPPGERTFAHMLKEAGYATGIFGKWQLAGDELENAGQTPIEAGFDRYFLWHAGTRGARYTSPTFAYLDPESGQEKVETFSGDYGPDVAAAQLRDFIRACVERGERFLAYDSMILPHEPFRATPLSPEWTANPQASGTKFFADMVKYMDQLIGELVAELDRLGVRENTLIIVTADNGTSEEIISSMRNGQQVQGGKGSPTDAGTHVPLLVNWSGRVAPGQTCEDLVDTTDFLPTLAEAAGAALPVPPGDGTIDGVSFLPGLLGKPAKPREWVLVDYTEDRQDDYGLPRARFARDRRYKLYDVYVRKDRSSGEIVEEKSGQFFDVAADPEERSPILEPSGDAAAARQRLRGVLDSMKPWSD